MNGTPVRSMKRNEVHVVAASWANTSLTSRQRVALWLRDAVGEGGWFTSQELRAAVPGIEEVVRRRRELTKQGWQFSTYREHAGPSDRIQVLRVGTVG